jgi:hypothetical protein
VVKGLRWERNNILSQDICGFSLQSLILQLGDLRERTKRMVWLGHIRKDCFQVKSNLLTDFRFTTHMNIMILN